LKRRTIFILFVLAFLAHLTVLRFYGLNSAAASPIELDRAAEAKQQLIEVTPLTPLELAATGARQVIEVPPGPDEEPLPGAKYLASRSMRSEKETMARPGEPFAGHAGPPVSSQSLFKSGSRGKQVPDGEGLTMAERIKPGLTGPISASGLISGARDFSGAKDFLEGAAWGDVTMANTYKFQYAYFFYNLRDSIRFYWNPEPALHLIPQGSDDLVTRVRFVLNQDGLLEGIEILGSSGFSTVDRAAVNAIGNSTPVFKVPEDLLDRNHQLVLVCEFRILRHQ